MTRLRHVPFAVLLALGIALRAVVMVAYRPALMLTDSFGYLERAHHFVLNQVRPAGYSAFLWPILRVVDSRAAIAGVQHVLVLGLAVACYAFLIRRGLPWWGACLAVLPVLFDPLQLVLEHYVLSDLLFEVLVVAACLVVLWWQRPGMTALVVAGLLVAAATLTRGAGSFLVIVFVVALLCLRVGWSRLLAFLLAVALPVLGYMVAFHARYGEYATSTFGPRFLYARLAPIVSCTGVEMPAYEKPLCPRHPVGQRPSTDYYMWHGKDAPQYHVVPPPGLSQIQVVHDWDKRMVRAQPLTYARAALADWGRGFAPVRTYEVPGYPARRWLFQGHNWTLDEFVRHGILRPHVLQGQSSDRPAARFLTAYGKHLWTPGPLLAALLLASAAAAFGLRRARFSGDRAAIGLLAGSCVVVLLTGAAFSGFSWRYQLAQLPLLPLAGALAVAALVRGRAPGRQLTPSMPSLDRMTDRLVGVLVWLPVPAAGRSAVQDAARAGRLQPVVATLVSAVAGCVVGADAAWSGWAASATATVAGVVVAVAAAVLLLVPWTRARKDGVPPGLEQARPPASRQRPVAHR